MNVLQKLILGKDVVEKLQTLSVLEMQLKAMSLYQTGVKYRVDNGRIVTPADNKIGYIQDGYNVNDIIFSVINMILDKVVLPEWGLYKVVKESSLKDYQRIMTRKNITGKDYKRAMQLKSEAVEPLSSFNLQAGKLKELLKYANDIDTFQDHNRALFLYKLLTGDYFEWGRILDAGANAGIPNSLDCLPSQYMNIKVADEFPVRPSSYGLTIWNQQFDKESILHEKYVNPNWDINGQQLYGFAPLRAFQKNTARNNAAKDAATAKFYNGGVEEIAYIDHPDFSLFTIEERKQQIALLKEKWQSEGVGTRNQGRVNFSGVPMGNIHLGNSPVELGIIDSEKWDAIMFCNGYGVPPELLGLTQKTYNNVKEAEKALTTRSAIPLLTSRRNSLNRKFQTDWGFKGQNIYVDYDTEVFTELQADMQETMTAISMLTMRTPNEEREAINWEMRPEPEADEVWVKTGTGMQPLSDYQASVVDQALQASLLNEQANGNSNTGNNGTNGKIPATNGATNSANGKARVSYS